jgi:hypothetical protein
VAPSSLPAADSREEPALGWIVLSYVLALVLPVAGMLVAAFWLRPRGSRHWAPVFFLSLAWFALSWALYFRS